MLELVQRGVLDVAFNVEDAVDRLIELQRTYVNVPMSLADACLVRMTELHARSRVLTTDSDFHIYRRNQEASTWFAKARTVLDDQGARPLRAIVDYDEALMYVRRGNAGDRQRAQPLVDSALVPFRALGMPGWIRRAEHLIQHGQEWHREPLRKVESSDVPAADARSWRF